jgi:hypothetical protein
VSRIAVSLALLVWGIGYVLGCERESKPEHAPVASSEVELDLGAVRVSVVDGLEAAVRDPAVAQQLGLAARFESPEVEPALERLLARATSDAELARIGDAFFLALQDSPAMRAALLEHARQNPELVDTDLAALRNSFVADVERRLTRDELAAALEQHLRAMLRRNDEALAQAWMLEAGGASGLAAAVLARLQVPQLRSKLAEWLGREGLQSVLVRHFADPKRATQLLLALAPTLLSAQALVEILDHPRTAELLAGALGRALQDEQVRVRCEGLFALALAPELDATAFTQELARLLDEPAVTREAAALASAVARGQRAREVGARDLARIPAAERDARLLETLD